MQFNLFGTEGVNDYKCVMVKSVFQWQDPHSSILSILNIWRMRILQQTDEISGKKITISNIFIFILFPFPTAGDVRLCHLGQQQELTSFVLCSLQ